MSGWFLGGMGGEGGGWGNYYFNCLYNIFILIAFKHYNLAPAGSPGWIARPDRRPDIRPDRRAGH